MPLPTNASVGRLRAPFAGAPCSSTISRGGFTLPRPTARIPPIFSRSSSFSANTAIFNPCAFASLRASDARCSGVHIPPGSLDRSRATFADSARICPSFTPRRSATTCVASGASSAMPSSAGAFSVPLLYLSKR